MPFVPGVESRDIPRELCHLQHHNTCLFTQPNMTLGLDTPRYKYRNGVCYRLVGAVIYHTLGLNCGHYTSYFLDNNQNQWFHADDEKVLPAQLSTVLQQDPFLLLYELCEKPVHALSLRQCERIINSQWLSDEILQCYFKLICEEIGISAFILGSQFMQKLSDEGYTGVKRWYQKV
jgi:hypothetical protein